MRKTFKQAQNENRVPSLTNKNDWNFPSEKDRRILFNSKRTKKKRK